MFARWLVILLLNLRAGALPAQIQGQAMDEAMEAVGGARVRVLGAHGDVLAQAMTDAAGTFTLRDLEPGQVELVVELPGFETSRRVYELEEGAVCEAIAFLRVPAVASFHPVSNRGGQPVTASQQAPRILPRSSPST